MNALPAQQVQRLAELEQDHGQVHRLPDENRIADQLLSFCSTGTRVYVCRNCMGIFTIEPDGEIRVWVWDHENHPVSFGEEDIDD